MDVFRSCAVASLAVLVLAACGGETVVAAPAREAGSPSTPSSTPGTASPSDLGTPATASPGDLGTPARSARALFESLDRAIAGETSVRQEMGNRNPPAPVVLEQEYGAGRDGFSLTVDLGPGVDAIRIMRVDGLVHAAGERPRPMSEVDPEETALMAVLLHSDVRQDFRRMAELSGDLTHVGEEKVRGIRTHHYRMTLTLTPGANPATVPTQLRGPKEADLWVAANGLPVRLEVRYAEPLEDIPGTGVSRTDYSAWSEPLHLDPQVLERS